MARARLRALAFVTVLAMVLPLIAACGQAGPTPTPVIVKETVPVTVKETVVVQVTPTPGPKRGGTLIVGLMSPVLSLDPADYRDRQTETVIRNMFDGLVTRTKDNQVVLEMAKSATLIDPQTWEFKLKEGMTFHNGDPVTAEDVKFTFDRIITEKAIEYPEPHTAARKGLIAPPGKRRNRGPAHGAIPSQSAVARVHADAVPPADHPEEVL